MVFVIIENKNKETISVNLMGYFKLFLAKYTDMHLYFTSQTEKKHEICSNHFILKTIENKTLQEMMEQLDTDFNKKYSDNFDFEIIC